jgi:hypothetical protein
MAKDVILLGRGGAILDLGPSLGNTRLCIIANSACPLTRSRDFRIPLTDYSRHRYLLLVESLGRFENTQAQTISHATCSPFTLNLSPSYL